MKKKTKIIYISQIYDIIKAANQCLHPVHITQGTITVEGRSLLGLLLLDLFLPVYIETEDEKEFEKFTSFLEFEDEKKEN